MVEWGGPQMTIWRICIAFWIPKATNTHQEYIILIGVPTVTTVTRTHFIMMLYVFWLTCMYMLPYIYLVVINESIYSLQTFINSSNFDPNVLNRPLIFRTQNLTDVPQRRGQVLHLCAVRFILDRIYRNVLLASETNQEI
jgi:hypothetical protein